MAKARGKTANFFVWIILGLLIIGLAGFGVDGFGGSVRSIGSVGDREISAQDYASALQQRQQQMAQDGDSMSIAEMREQGIDQDILRDLVTRAALENEADRMGLSVGDDFIAREITSIQGFQGVDGGFDREAYRQILRQQGLSESEFEEELRREVARDILQTAVLGGARQPDSFMDAIMTYVGERRDFSLARLDSDDLEEDISSPTDSELEAFHEDNIDDYTRPEARRITYAWVTPLMVLEEIEVDEDALREMYEERSDEYSQPERRLVERLVFPDTETAEDAAARIEAGEADFAEIVEERGLDLADTDMGDVTRAALGDAGDAVFDLEEPGIVGPVETSLGPALFRMNAVLDAQEIDFEDVRDELRDEYARDRAARFIDQRRDEFDDLLAAGATLEEIAEETVMELGEIDYTGDSDAEIAGYESFREAAEAVEEDDFPELRTLDGDGLFALRLDEIVPAEPEPLEDVMVQVIDDWERAQIVEELAERAEELAGEIADGTGFDEAGLMPERFEGMTRDAFIEGAPGDLMESVFDLEPGETRVVRDADAVFVLRVDEVMPPAEDDPDLAELREMLADQTRQTMSEDIFMLYAQALQDEAGISLDQSAIDAVHSGLR